MDYKIDLDIWGGVFAVPAAVTDEYIKLAGADNLKVLLYCLRHSGAELSDGEISRATGVKTENVKTSMEFWEQRLFAKSRRISEDVKPVQSPALSVRKIEAERGFEYTPTEISEFIGGDEKIKLIIERIESKTGPIKSAMARSLVRAVIDDKIKPEVLLMLVEYSLSKDKFSPAYIKTVAKDWVYLGIDSVVKAEARIKELNEAEKLRIKPAKKEKKPKKASFDIDELNKQIMEEYGECDGV